MHELDLSATALLDADAAALVNASDLRDLRLLDLRRNPGLTARGEAAIRAAPQFRGTTLRFGR